ncbi:MAG TPA: hypothetical protein VF698_12120, partial [Thermoanaerobaculia bacterium]
MSLDLLLRQAAAAGGRELRLATGQKVVIVTPAGEKEVQGPEVTPAMMQQFVGPVVPASARAALAAGRAEWTMKHSDLGDIRVLAGMSGSNIRATFYLDGGGAAAAPAQASTSTAPSHAASVVSGGPTAEMDSLFRQMFEMKASDLHMCVGAAPLVRHDGEIKPLPGRSVLSAADMERILMPIAPERNREEFKVKHDTDFAYEIPGVSRFRSNFYMDRKGMGGVFRVIPSKIITAEEMGLSKEILDLCFL